MNDQSAEGGRSRGDEAPFWRTDDEYLHPTLAEIFRAHGLLPREARPASHTTTPSHERCDTALAPRSEHLNTPESET